MNTMHIPSLSSNITFVHAGKFELALRVRCERGYNCGYLRLRPRTFDASVLDCKMLEYPSGKMVLSKGWDVFNHEQNKMAVPSFAVWVNGQDRGDAWFDVPNYQNAARGVLDTEFGFYVSHPGVVDLRLVIVEGDRRHFHWGMVETFRVGPDNRRSAPITPIRRVRDNPRVPWLFLHDRSPAQVRARFRRNRPLRAPMARMLKLIQAGHGVPYVSTEQVIAAAAFLTDSSAWIALARRRLRELCTVPTWSGRENPRVMQGDNDVQRGFNLMAVTMLAHYLWDKLDETERQLALSKSREYGRKLYEFSVLNKRWGSGMGDLMTHESIPMMGVSIAAMVFYDQFPEAHEWLAWAHGRMLHALATAPIDGRAWWSSYSPCFVVAHAAAVHDFAHENIFDRPFLANLTDALLRCRYTPTSLCDVAQMGELYARQILATIAEYTGNPEAAWGFHWYWHTLAQRYGQQHFVGWPDMMWLLPKGRAPKMEMTRSHLFKDTGLAVMRTAEEKPKFCCLFQSGIGVGRNGFKLRNRYNLESHSPNADAGIQVLVNGAFVIMSSPGCYRKGFRNESVITVDGSGHYMDDRWLGCDIKKSWLSKMVFFRDAKAKSVAIGDNTGAYREELGVTRSRRKVTLLKTEPRLVVEDLIQLRQPRRLALLFHSTKRIRQLAPGRFEFTSDNMAVLARNDAYKKQPPQKLVVEVANPGRYHIRVSETLMVLPYIYGMNTGDKTGKFKGLGTAPPPRPQFLEIAVPGKAAVADFRVDLRPM